MLTSSALDYAADPLTRAAIVASTASIPRSCICTWAWEQHRWHLNATYVGCPWHGSGT